MAAVAVTVAEEVLQAIKAAELSQRGFSLQRSYADWDRDHTRTDELELEETEKLHVDVVGHTTEQEAELSSRTTLMYLTKVDVAVRRKFGQACLDDRGRIRNGEIDPLMLFTQELYAMFVKARLSDDFSSVWQNIEIIAAPVRSHLRELRQFTGVIRLSFRSDVDLELTD